MIGDIDWICQLSDQVPLFLDRARGATKGFYKYTIEGDIYPETVHWGLGNTVFATKILYTLGKLDTVKPEEQDDMASFIISFQRKDGSIYDPVISKRRSPIDIIRNIQNSGLSNLFNQQTIRAETRQAFSSLRLLGKMPDIPYLKIPYTPERIKKYLFSLNWNKPWSAGSHFSHLLFFLNINKSYYGIDERITGDLITEAINCINRMQSPIDGSWYTGINVSQAQKINGAMKIISGLLAANRYQFNFPEQLIDLCLNKCDLGHACNNLDSLYVIRYANDQTGGTYRYEEIREYCIEWINVCKNYYYPDIGGFSFYRNKSNQFYYGTRISKGADEPDIHATALYLWGLALASNVLGISAKTGFKEYLT